MQTSEIIIELAKALNAFQSEVENVPRDAANPFFKSRYTSLSQLWDTVRKPMTKHGLCITQFPSGENSLTTRLMHTSGEWMESTVKMTPKDNTPQGHGSALTYMRRYALSAVLGIASEDDDDGNAASARDAKQPQQARREAPDMTGKQERPPTDRQKEFLRDLFTEQGWDPEEIQRRVDAVKTASEASALIEEMKGGGKPDAKPEETKTVSDQAFDRSVYIKALYGYGTSSGLSGPEVDAFCHIMSPSSIKDWTVDDFKTYGGDGPQGLKSKDHADAEMICMEKINALIEEYGIKPSDMNDARATLDIPQTSLDTFSLPNLATLAAWIRSQEVFEDGGGEQEESLFKADSSRPDYCELHGEQMKERAKDGEKFYSHGKRADGKMAYCHGSGFPGEHEA